MCAFGEEERASRVSEWRRLLLWAKMGFSKNSSHKIWLKLTLWVNLIRLLIYIQIFMYVSMCMRISIKTHTQYDAWPCKFIHDQVNFNWWVFYDSQWFCCLLSLSPSSSLCVSPIKRLRLLCVNFFFFFCVQCVYVYVACIWDPMTMDI